jgi:hypothetical protein
VPITLAYPDTPLDEPTRRSWSWVFALAAAVAVVIAAWPLSSWQMRQSVAVEMGNRMRCTGSTLVKVNNLPAPAYRLVPGMRCRISYTVTNSAPLTAHLGRATFHLLGRATGLSLRAVDPNPQVEPSETDGGADAVYNLDRDLASGDSATFTIDAVFNPRGCSGENTRISITRTPDVEVSFLDVSGIRTGDVAFTLVGTKDSACPAAR